MKTELIHIDMNHALAEQVAPWGAALRRGELVAFPTETVYGLGANGLDEAAVRKIYLAKGRPSDNPLILHVNGIAMLRTLVQKISPLEAKLIQAYWPGPLTLVFPRSAIVPDRVTGGGETVAVRAPAHPVAQALISAAGVPIAAPSANLSGRPSPCNAAAVLTDMDGRVAAILDGGACRIGLESTVAACEDNKITVYRPGAVTVEMLSQFAPTALDDALVTGKGIPKAPGMKYRHYAPKAPVYICLGTPERLTKFMKEHYEPDVGFLISAETARELPLSPHIYVWGERLNQEAMAAHLYDGLLYLDTQPVRKIYAEGTAAIGLGTAIMNRLNKAAGYHVVEVD